MLNYIETEVVIRREFRENRELTDKYRRASLTPGEWQNLGQVGDPMGLVAKNEIVVGFSGDVDRMKTIVDKLHKRPFGRVKPGSAQYQRTGLQLVVDWMGYYPDGVSDQRVRYYDSSDTRDAGSRVELLDTKLRGNEVVMTVLKPASREFRGPSDRGPEWSEYEYGMSKDEQTRAFAIAIKGDIFEQALYSSVQEGGIPFWYTEDIRYQERDEQGRMMQYSTSRGQKFHFGVMARKPSDDQEVRTGKWPDYNVMEITVTREEAQQMFQSLVIPK